VKFDSDYNIVRYVIKY